MASPLRFISAVVAVAVLLMSSLPQPHKVVPFSRFSTEAATTRIYLWPGRTLHQSTFYLLIFTRYLSLLYFCIVNASLNTNSYLRGCSCPTPTLCLFVSLAYSRSPFDSTFDLAAIVESSYMRCMEMAPVSIWATAPRIPLHTQHHYIECSVIKLNAHLCCNKSIQVSPASWQLIQIAWDSLSHYKRC